MHNLRCEFVDLDLQQVYDDLLTGYRERIAILKRISPDTVALLKESALNEIGWLGEKIDLLMGVNSQQANEELNRIVPRHVRLLDMLGTLEGEHARTIF